MLSRSCQSSCLVRKPLFAPYVIRRTYITVIVEQFSKYANLFFLFTACIQQIPGVSPTNRWTTIGPLAVVLLASAFKEVQEDLVRFGSTFCRHNANVTKQKRHQSDAELNARLAKVLTPTDSFELKRWKDIRVGDVVRMENDDFIPADLILVTSSEPEGFCYIETSNLDGYVDAYILQTWES